MWPPPRWRTVMRPRLLRPPFLVIGANRDFSGDDLVISLKSDVTELRLPGEVGLCALRPID